jgi:hypothetical protein
LRDHHLRDFEITRSGIEDPPHAQDDEGQHRGHGQDGIAGRVASFDVENGCHEEGTEQRPGLIRLKGTTLVCVPALPTSTMISSPRRSATTAADG